MEPKKGPTYRDRRPSDRTKVGKTVRDDSRHRKTEPVAAVAPVAKDQTERKRVKTDSVRDKSQAKPVVSKGAKSSSSSSKPLTKTVPEKTATKQSRPPQVSRPDPTLINREKLTKVAKSLRQSTAVGPARSEPKSPKFDDNSESSESAYDYEDDFEDYESDFESEAEETEQKQPEDDNNNEVDVRAKTSNKVDVLQGPALLRRRISLSVINVASQDEPRFDPQNLVKQSQETEVPSVESDKVPAGKRRSSINFVGAKQRQETEKALSKAKKRGEKLLDLITLDTVAFDLFSLPPKPYDEFMQAFGSVNTKQAYVQTGDDDVPEETQTDVIEKLDLWTQFPPHSDGSVGGDFVSKIELRAEIGGVKDWKRLRKLISCAGRVVCTLLEEDQIDDKTSLSKSRFGFSDSFAQLQPPFRKASKVVHTSQCKLQPSLFLAIYSNPTGNQGNQDGLGYKGMVFEWNIHRTASPQKILTCRSEPTCCCYNDSASIAFAGMEDGSVAVWDLTESDSVHQKCSYGEKCWTFRAPTYSTAEIFGEEGHRSAVIAMCCRQDSFGGSEDVSYSKLVPSGGIQRSRAGIVQLATLEQESRIIIWVVSELAQNPGLETDLGLSPDGRVQLIKSASINLDALPNLEQHLQLHPTVLDFAVHPQDGNKFLVATDMGAIVCCSVNGGRYKAYGHPSDAATQVTSLTFHPHVQLDCFLAGYSDGSIQLFITSKDKPLMIWGTSTKGQPVLKVAWSACNPNVFYVLDAKGTFYVWDLNESDCRPVICCDKAETKSGITCFSSVNCQEQKRYRPYVILGYENGLLEIHYLSSKYSQVKSEEIELLKTYVDLL